LLVRGRNGQDVCVIDAENGKELRKWTTNAGPVQGFVLSPDRTSVFIGDIQQVVQYEIKSGKQLKTFPIAVQARDEDFAPFDRTVRFALAIAPDGKTLAAPAQAAVAFFDVVSGKEIEIAPGHRSRIDSVSFGPGAKQAVTGSTDNGLFLWNIAD